MCEVIMKLVLDLALRLMAEASNYIISPDLFLESYLVSRDVSPLGLPNRNVAMQHGTLPQICQMA